MKMRLPSVAVLSFAGLASSAQDPFLSDELYQELRRDPTVATWVGGHRVQVVNARYEPCSRREDARYLLVATPVDAGYALRVLDTDGTLLMEGHGRDPRGQVLDGTFRYYHDNGAPSAEGRYANGLKTGVWHRYNMQGHTLPDKEYDGLNWDDKQVKLGLASISRVQGDIAVME